MLRPSLLDSCFANRSGSNSAGDGPPPHPQGPTDSARKADHRHPHGSHLLVWQPLALRFAFLCFESCVGCAAHGAMAHAAGRMAMTGSALNQRALPCRAPPMGYREGWRPAASKLRVLYLQGFLGHLRLLQLALCQYLLTFAAGMLPTGILPGTSSSCST